MDGRQVQPVEVCSPRECIPHVEALEFLSLGILGKRALWKALLALAPGHTEPHGIDFAALIARADARYAATEAMRLWMAVEAFGKPTEGGHSNS